MSKLSRKQRQEIIDEYLVESGASRFHPEQFLAWLSERPDHPAYGWFEWDDERAAAEYRVSQARHFAAGCRIVASMSVVSRGGSVKVVTTMMPAMISPRDGWRNGGGYVPLSADDPVSMDAFCEEAACALDAWCRRYEGAVLHRGGNLTAVRKLVALLAEREAA